MSIFNSLGSNYSRGFTWRSLISVSSKNKADELTRALGDHYGGQATLTYKGREALEIALKRTGLPPGSLIGINGFTCYAVYRAVQNAGFAALAIDITAGELNFGLSELKQAHTLNSKLKAIIVQNTLGFPADMPALTAYCHQNNILIIEDLAHSTGCNYQDNQEVGTVGTFTMLSFSQDKPVDVVAGGALIDRRGEFAEANSSLPPIGLTQRLKNRLYPFWSGLIRMTYAVGLGKYIHFALKKLRFMATPMSDDLTGLHHMSGTTAGLVLKRWQHHNEELAHRREIAQIYQTELPTVTQLKPAKGKALYLRYPILVNNRESLINFLRRHKIYIGDTWYDTPIGPKKYLSQTDYKQGSCPEAEKLTNRIVNLPTHRHVSVQDAKNICERIKQWQISQQ